MNTQLKAGQKISWQSKRGLPKFGEIYKVFPEYCLVINESPYWFEILTLNNKNIEITQDSEQ